MGLSKSARNTLFCLILLLFASFTALSQPYATGSLNNTYIDPSRNNRQIPVAVYYPAQNPGSGVAMAPGSFPVVSFGHGFVTVHTAYKYLWEVLVPLGYIVAFPLTEGSAIPPPSHMDFGLDIAFVARKIVNEGLTNPSSVFYGHVKDRRALMGHSMGGGSAYMGAASDTSITTLVTLAAGNISSLAINAAAEISVPTLLFAGQNDCITPPSQHQQPLYDSTASLQKVMITVLGGGHCYFADYNFNCSLGELTCSPQPTISRAQQQQTTLDFLIPWLDYTLNDNNTAWQLFYDSLTSSGRITYQLKWTLTGRGHGMGYQKCNQSFSSLGERLDLEIPASFLPVAINVFNSSGQLVYAKSSVKLPALTLDTAAWPKGVYFLRIFGTSYLCAGKIIRQ